MLRRRRLKVAYLIGFLLLLAASLHAPTAYSAPGDPPTGSPAGAVYELPFEQGRADGAPKGSGGTEPAGGGGSAATGGAGGDTAGQGGSGSLYRTENNFGSSSQVPGLAASGGAGPGGGGSAAGAGAGAGAALAAGAVAGHAADAGHASVSASVVLLGAIGLLAAGIGVLSRRFAQPR